MKHIGTCLVSFSALLATSAGNPCLEPTNADYSCELSESGTLVLRDCDITDEDVDDIASCLDDLGRENIEILYLDNNTLTTLPEGIFEGLTALTYLDLYYNAFTTLPEGIFAGVTALEWLVLSTNTLTTLPEGIFGGLTALTVLSLSTNTLTTLPEGIFGGLTALTMLFLNNNTLTTLPEGIFEGLTALAYLHLHGNSLECLPVTPTALEELDDYAASNADGLRVDWYGNECGCSTAEVTNVCGQETCTPGEFGYICDGATTLAPVPTTAPEPTVEAEAPASIAPTPDPGSKGASETTPMVAGVVSAVTGVVLIGLGLWLRWRRNGQQVKESSQPLPSTRRGLENDVRLEPQTGTGSGTAVTLSDGGHLRAQDRGASHPPVALMKTVSRASNEGSVVTTLNTTTESPVPAPAAPSPPQGSELEPAPAPTTAAASSAAGAARVQIAPASPTPASATVPATAQAPARATGKHPEQEKGYEPTGLVLGREDAKDSSEDQPLTATTSTAEQSTGEQAELRQECERTVSSASAVDESTPGGAWEDTASSASGRRGSNGGLRLGEVVMEAAQNLAYQCQIPGVSEAAAVVSTLVTLVSDNRDIKSRGDSNLRKCRSIVRMLERASKVAGKHGEATTAEQRDLIEEVQFAVEDMVELIKTYQSKNKLAKVLMSTLFKRRQDDLEVAIDQALGRLQFGLHVQVGEDVGAVKEGMDAYQYESQAEAHKARRARRQRKLDQIEIPEDQVWISDEMLGKGGFGKVFLADYNTRNAAAKVLYITHDLGKLGEHEVLEARSSGQPNAERQKSQRKAFLRELDAMIRLRSPHTVGVYGAITSRPDRLVLVMELLAGGDLRTLLKNSEQPLPEEQSRRIIADICTGMHFLHCKDTVHGDLKSANVLLDGAGRVKIGDFGTSRWSHHTSSTGLATYTKTGQNTQMSFAWSAPEVLSASGSTFASDVYSFGIVAWEVLSRELPWESVAHPREVYIRVVLNELRPEIPVDAPADLAKMTRACWAGEPEARPTFSTVMERIKSDGWRE